MSKEHFTKQSDKIYELLTKYAITGNGIALSITLVSILHTEPNLTKIPHAPLWFFFWGMIFGGLYAIFTDTFMATFLELESYKKLQEIKNRITEEKAFTEDDIDKLISIDKARKDINNLEQTFNTRFVNSKLVSGLRNAQELFFILSYFCLMVGIYMIITSIN